jgi:transcription elongation GreA/GreB family factor
VNPWVLSNESEIAKGLLGQGLGETVTVGGRQYKIAKIEAHTL